MGLLLLHLQATVAPQYLWLVCLELVTSAETDEYRTQNTSDEAFPLVGQRRGLIQALESATNSEQALSAETFFSLTTQQVQGLSSEANEHRGMTAFICCCNCTAKRHCKPFPPSGVFVG